MTDKPRIMVRDQNDVALDSLDGRQYKNAKLNVFLNGNQSVLDLDVYKTDIDSESIRVGHSLSFVYMERDFWFKIISVKQVNSYYSVTAWSVGTEWTVEQIGPYSASKAMTIQEYLTVIDFEKTMNIGINELSTNTRTLSWDSSETKLSRLQSVITNFNGEYEIVPVLNSNGGLVNFQLNIYKEHSDESQGLGTDRRSDTLRVGREIDYVERTDDISNVYTAITARGKDGISIKDLDYEFKDKDGNLLLKTVSKATPIYPDVYKLYSPYYRDTYPSIVNKTYDRYVVYDAGELEYSTVNDLAVYMIRMLLSNSIPETEYTIKGYDGFWVGDSVRVIDDTYADNIYYDARIIELNLDLDKPWLSESTYSNVEQKTGSINKGLLSRMTIIARKYGGNDITYGGSEPKDSKVGDLWLTPKVNTVALFAMNRGVSSSQVMSSTTGYNWNIYSGGEWIELGDNTEDVINSISAIVSDLSSRIDTLSNANTSLENRVTQLELDYSNISNTVTQLELDYSNISNTVTGLESRVTELESKNI